MQLTLSQAVSITGKSKSTLSKAIKDGVISATRQGDHPNSPFRIELSELLRVFPAVNSEILGNQNITLQHTERALNRIDQPITHNQTHNDTIELAVLRERAKHYEDRIRDLKDQLSEAKISAEDYKQRFLEADTKLLGVLKTINPNKVDGSVEHSNEFSDTMEHLDKIQHNKRNGVLEASTEIDNNKKSANPFVLTDAYRLAPKSNNIRYRTTYQFKLDDLNPIKRFTDSDDK